MAIQYKTADEINIIRENGDLLGRVHGEISKVIKPGISTKSLDKLAYDYLHDHQAKPSFLDYNGYPASLCISVNDAVVHGIPNEYVLKDGDIVSVDCGVYKNAYHADSAYTYKVGTVSDKVQHLLSATLVSLERGISQVKQGSRIGDVSFAVQSYVESYGYGVVRELVGHGLGRSLHEDPQVPNYGPRGKGVKILNGLVIAIEPMINLGKAGVVQLNDGWTIKTKDGQPSAHFEHTVAFLNGQSEVLTTFKYIEGQ